MNPEETEGFVISDVIKLTVDIASLYLSSTLSDIKIIVNGETLPAHSKNIIIEDTSTRAFKIILQYIYTGRVKLSPADVKIYPEVLKLAQRYSFDEFKDPISANSVLNFLNVYTRLNEANLFGLDPVRNKCHEFIENHLEEFAADDKIVKMTQTSMVNLLKRETLILPEVIIFRIVLKWRKANDDFGDLVLKSIAYSRMTVMDILSTVWPSNTVKCDQLINAMAESVGLKPKTSNFKPIDINVATPELGAKVLIGISAQKIINGNNNFENFSTSAIGDKNGCIIELGQAYVINYIRMRLYDGDNRHFKYYIEVSMDKNKWKKIVDYSTIPTRSIQHLYFQPERVKFVRIVGAHVLPSQSFHIIFFEAYYKSTVPTVINGIIRPIKNVATREMNAIVLSGFKGSYLIDGDYKNYDGNFGYSSTNFTLDPLLVELAQPYLISSLKILLWNKDPRTYSFYIETSVDKVTWQMALDRRNTTTTGWQLAQFTERVVVFIRITGTAVSNGDGHLHCVHLECPASKASN